MTHVIPIEAMDDSASPRQYREKVGKQNEK